MYVNGYKTKDTQHKIYINIKVYQTNSPPKLVTSKTLFPLTQSFPPKSITPHEERHSILKFLPLFDTIVKGHKKSEDLIRDRQKKKKKQTQREQGEQGTIDLQEKENRSTVGRGLGKKQKIEQCMAML